MTRPDRLLDQARARHRAGDRPGAERLYRRVLAVRPDDPRARLLLGTLLAQGGAVAEAAEHFARAAEADPANADALTALGTALAQLGRTEEAAGQFTRALTVNPDHVQARFSLGVLETGDGALEQAAEQFRRVLALQPGHADARLNLAEVLRRSQRYEEALAVLDDAVRRHPRLSPLKVNRGKVLKALGRLPEAEAAYREALAVNPNDAVAYEGLLLCTLYDPERDPAAIRDLHAEWGARLDASVPPPAAHANDPDPDRPLKIGYLSPDLRDHPVASFIGPALAHHDPDRYPVTCYASVARPDAVTGRLQARVPEWRDVRPLNDAALANLIRRDGIDVLVDLAGHTAGSRLPVLALSPAPVQATWLGYPATSGLPAVGYRLTDDLADPPGAEGLYVERLERLEGTFCAFEPPPDAPDPGPLPALANGHVTFGSQANPVKVNAKVVALWARVLAAVPDARLFLAGAEYAAGPVRERVLSTLSAGGVAPERVAFDTGTGLSKADFMARYRPMDIGLDTFPYAGHTSTCESLWMGVPVISLAAGWYIQRVGASLLAAVGLPDLAVDSADAYVERARALADDLPALAELRDGLRQRMARSPLLDGAGLTRRLEAAYRRMWRRWCEGAGGR
jgi:protein O-GlcNAc transferase